MTNVWTFSKTEKSQKLHTTIFIQDGPAGKELSFWAKKKSISLPNSHIIMIIVKIIYGQWVGQFYRIYRPFV